MQVSSDRTDGCGCFQCEVELEVRNDPPVNPDSVFGTIDERLVRPAAMLKVRAGARARFTSAR